jgi:ParB-like chromosome segregation protein Spo0J
VTRVTTPPTPGEVRSPHEYRTVPLDELTPHPDNARRGNIEMIADSLATHGQFKPIVVQRSTMNVVAGNHTLEAARSLGWNTIETVLVDVDDEQAKRILLIDNRANDVAGYDDRALADLLRSLADTDGALLGTGYTADDLADLLDILDVPTLEELADQHGEHVPESVWPVLRFKVPPQVRDRYLRLVEGYPGGDDALFALLVEWAESGKAA